MVWGRGSRRATGKGCRREGMVSRWEEQMEEAQGGGRRGSRVSPGSGEERSGVSDQEQGTDLVGHFYHLGGIY